MSEQTSNVLNDLKKEVACFVRNELVSGRITLPKQTTVYDEELDLFVNDKAILLGGLDVLKIDVCTNPNKQHAKVTLYFYVDYTVLDADGINDTFFPVGSVHEFSLPKQYMNVIKDNYLNFNIHGQISELKVGSIKDLVVSLPEDNKSFFDLSYKVEWDGEVRIVV